MPDISNITPARFEILKKITKNDWCATDLAKELGFSVPYVHQQLVLLEAQGYIKKKILRDKLPGKPKQVYKLIQNFAYVTILKDGFADEFKISKQDKMLDFLQIISELPISSQNLMSKYYWAISDDFEKILSLSLISYDDTKIELFAITTEDELQNLRKTISHIKFGVKGAEKTVSCWVHTLKECEDGISKKDNYYLAHLTRARKIIEKEGIIDKLKEKI
jgi:predicted transcriptional regulator